MTKNRRYEAHYDTLNDRKIAEAPSRPTTLPTRAYGPNELAWLPRGVSAPAVWAWISWRDRPAERVAAFAKGWNDRVVVVEWSGPTGTLDTVVWRNAVTRRNAPSNPDP